MPSTGAVPSFNKPLGAMWLKYASRHLREASLGIHPLTYMRESISIAIEEGICTYKKIPVTFKPFVHDIKRCFGRGWLEKSDAPSLHGTEIGFQAQFIGIYRIVRAIGIISGRL
jgi:hypothetical protein